MLITADALHCQQQSARFITQELGGDYLFGLKGNQSGILDKAQRLLAQQASPTCGLVGKGSPPPGQRGEQAFQRREIVRSSGGERALHFMVPGNDRRVVGMYVPGHLQPPPRLPG